MPRKNPSATIERRLITDEPEALLQLSKYYAARSNQSTCGQRGTAHGGHSGQQNDFRFSTGVVWLSESGVR
jgi:hypothetical protein